MPCGREQRGRARSTPPPAWPTASPCTCRPIRFRRRAAACQLPGRPHPCGLRPDPAPQGDHAIRQRAPHPLGGPRIGSLRPLCEAIGFSRREELLVPHLSVRKDAGMQRVLLPVVPARRAARTAAPPSSLAVGAAVGARSAGTSGAVLDGAASTRLPAVMSSVPTARRSRLGWWGYAVRPRCGGRCWSAFCQRVHTSVWTARVLAYRMYHP